MLGLLRPGGGVHQGTRSATRARRTSRRRWRAGSAASRGWIFPVSPPRILARPLCWARFAEARGGRASGNQIGPAGAADLAKALASGQCGLTTLDLSGESAPYFGEASVLGSVR
eukprot:COSAG01_NODE_7578_length_3140_cov_40.993752_2_plen_114_part_00